MSNEVLGTIQCQECGGQASVMQTKRRGGHLYSQCPSCGLDQRTGKAVQNRLWHGVDWRSGVDPYSHRPANVTDDFKQPESKPEGQVEAKLTDWQPEETEIQPTPEAPKKRGGSGLGRSLLAVGVTLAGLAAILKTV